MPSVRVINEIKGQIFFITMTIKNWHYLFDRYDRFQILEDSFIYCQQNKNLKIYAFVFMLNHLHFVGSAKDMGAVIRDMKKYLSKAFKKNIQENEPSLLRRFYGKKGFEFWEKTNFPQLIYSEKFFAQKVNYIHMNPVKKQYVHLPEDWYWSSASKIPTRIMISELEL